MVNRSLGDAVNFNNNLEWKHGYRGYIAAVMS